MQAPDSGQASLASHEAHGVRLAELESHGWGVAPADATSFVLRLIWLLCAQGGVKPRGARQDFENVQDALRVGRSALDSMRSRSKAAVIDWLWKERETIYREYQALTTDAARVEHLRSLPGIGERTKVQAACAFGVICYQP